MHTVADRLKIGFLSLLILFACGCASRAGDQSTADNWPQPELDVIEALLINKHPDILAAGGTLVVSELTDADSLVRTLTQAASVGVPAEAIDEFRRMNQLHYPLPAALLRRLPLQTFSEEALQTVFQAGPSLGWQEFYNEYPQTPGLITLSRVGFSSDGATAIVYYGIQSGGLNGQGRFVVLKLLGDGWQVTSIQIGGMWAA
jgi:hypothetical protein